MRPMVEMECLSLGHLVHPALPTHACATLQGQKSSSKTSIRLFAIGLNSEGETETLAKAHMVPAYGPVEQVACLGTQAQDGQSAWLVSNKVDGLFNMVLV